MRRVRFLRLYEPEYRDFIDFLNAEAGYFHEWGVRDGNTVAIIECLDGTCMITAPELVKFDKPFENAD